MRPVLMQSPHLLPLRMTFVHVPDLWPYEVANGLAIAYRRQRITADDEQVFIAALARLNIQVAHLDALALIRQATASAVRLGLTSYDSAYVDLALQVSVPIATLDRRMQQAAVASGVDIFNP